MAEVVVERSDSFEDWRLKTNQLGEIIGGDKTDMGGLNVIQKIEEVAAFNLTMAIALS